MSDNINRKDVKLSFGTKEGSIYVGECIYCNSKTNLEDEHSVPYGFWGKWELKDGSCRECACKTSKMELSILRHCLGGLREYFKSTSRRQKKKKVRTGVVTVEDETGNRLEAPIQDIIQWALLPSFDYLPRKIEKISKGKKHQTFSAVAVIFKKSLNPELTGFSMPSSNFNVTTWARFFSKVAYSEYIRTVDKNFRSEDLSNFILTGKGDLTNFVGGRPAGPQVACVFNIQHCAIPHSNGRYSVISYVRLFSFESSPSYLIHLCDLNGSENLPKELFVHTDWKSSGIWPTYPQEKLLGDEFKSVDWSPFKKN